MKTTAIIFVSLTALLTGCFAPINLTYESARMLDEGQVSLQGSYSRYSLINGDSVGTANLNNNFGFALGYGVSEKYSLGIRYEHMNISSDFNSIFGEDIDWGDLEKMDFFEFNNRIRLKEDVLALSIPLGFYLYTSFDTENPSGFGYMSIDPRLYITLFGSSDIFELTIIPKIHLLVGGWGGMAAFPGIALGIGLSSDLDKWAIRPEIGYDSFLSFGVGVNFNFNTVKKE
jgi:hypothetical protein